MNLVQLAAHVPWPLVAAWLAANLIPYLSALATRTPGWWTGAITAVLSFLDGFLAELSRSTDPIHWRAVLATAAGAWLIAGWHHTKILSGTAVEASLHARGYTGSRRIRIRTESR